MIIMGIDPGTTRIGFGIIESERGKLSHICHGLIASSSNSKGVVVESVVADINRLINKYKPDIVAVEKLFFFKNQKTIISVSEMRGVIMAALAMSNIPIKEFTPLQVKQSVSSYGRAGKDQVPARLR